MGASNHRRLRVGVIGLGRLWEARHKPALARLRDRFQVVAVYDQVLLRAALEARQLGCTAAEGLTELVARSDVDVVYVLTPQWFGLHAVTLACRFGKPVYCALPPAADLAGLREVAALVRESRNLYVPELPRRFYPATLRLRELLATRLGRPRLVLGHARLFGFDRYGDPGPSTQLSPSSLMVDPGGNLIDWCRFIFESEPVAIHGCGMTLGGSAGGGATDAGSDFESIGLEFPGGAMAQIGVARYHRTLWGEASRFLPQPGFQVFAERGAAWLEMPERLQWTDSEGVHEEHLPMEPSVGELLGDQFYRLVHGEPSLATTIDDALAVALLTSTLQRSREEGRRIVVSEYQESS